MATRCEYLDCELLGTMCLSLRGNDTTAELDLCLFSGHWNKSRLPNFDSDRLLTHFQLATTSLRSSISYQTQTHNNPCTDKMPAKCKYQPNHDFVHFQEEKSRSLRSKQARRQSIGAPSMHARPSGQKTTTRNPSHRKKNTRRWAGQPDRLQWYTKSLREGSYREKTTCDTPRLIETKKLPILPAI
jgi:hypothetical protein